MNIGNAEEHNDSVPLTSLPYFIYVGMNFEYRRNSRLIRILMTRLKRKITNPCSFTLGKSMVFIIQVGMICLT